MAGSKWMYVSEVDGQEDAVNLVLKGDSTFFISFIPDMAAANRKFGITKGVPQSGMETTLVRRGTNILGLNEYFGLDGDFRKEYEKLVPKGFEACYKFYLKQSKEG